MPSSSLRETALARPIKARNKYHHFVSLGKINQLRSTFLPYHSCELILATRACHTGPIHHRICRPCSPRLDPNPTATIKIDRLKLNHSYRRHVCLTSRTMSRLRSLNFRPNHSFEPIPWQIWIGSVGPKYVPHIKYPPSQPYFIVPQQCPLCAPIGNRPALELNGRQQKSKSFPLV